MSGWKDGRKKENKSRMSICLDGEEGGGGMAPCGTIGNLATTTSGVNRDPGRGGEQFVQ